MYFSNYFHKAFINLAGAIKQSGSTSDLVAGQIGFADAKTWDLIGTGSASVSTHPVVVLAQGSLFLNDKIGKFHGGYRESVKSRPINGRLITRFTKFVPRDEKPHVVQIGYNGAIDCACPSFERDRTYYLRVEVKGSPVLRTYTRNLYRTFGVYTGCPSDNCPDVACVDSADPKVVFEAFADQIVKDPEVAQFLKSVKVVTEGQSSIDGVDVDVYQATQCDEGDIKAIAAVLAAYPTAKLVGRDGATSTYEIRTTGAAPSDDQGGLTIAWTQTDTLSKLKKVICLTLPLREDGNSNLADIRTFYASTDNVIQGTIVVSEGDCSTTTTSTTTTSTTTTTASDVVLGCTEIIQMSIISDNEVDLVCEGVENGVFTFPQSYNGYSWEECPCCDAEVGDDCVGLRLIAKTSDEITDQFSNCSFDPMDHVETEPIIIIVNFVNMFGESCTFDSMAITEIQTPQIPQGLGEFAVRELILSASYGQDWFTGDVRIREALEYPYLQAIDRTKKYVIYTITHVIPTGIGPSGTIGQDRFLYRIYVEEGVSASTFETWMGNYLTSAGTGVSLETL